MKVILWLLIPVAIILLLCVYIFLCVRNAVCLVKNNKSSKYIRTLSLFITFIIILPMTNMIGAMANWSIIVLHVAFFMLITQLIYFIIKKITKYKPNKIVQYIYRFGIIPMICTAIVFTYGYINIRNIVETDYTIITDKINTNGYKIALFADVHFGTNINESNLQEVSDNISNKNVDIVLLCGDIVDEGTSYEEMQAVFKILGNTKSKYGTYFVYGNHDTSPYSKSPNYTESDLTLAIKNNNITILKDEMKNISDDLVLVGREDLSGNERLDINDLLHNVDKDKFILVMDHQPEEFIEKAKSGVDLQVSGHTHAGQIFPAGNIMNLFGISDLYYGTKTVDNMSAIVTSGVSGWGFSIRTQSHSEYVIINIEKK